MRGVGTAVRELYERIWRLRAWRVLRDRVHARLNWKNAGITLLLFYGAYVVWDSFQPRFLIEQIVVPKALEELGFTADAVTRQARDEMERIRGFRPAAEWQILPQSVPAGRFSPETPEFDLEIPGTKIPVRSLTSFLQSLVGRGPARISGELTAVSSCSQAPTAGQGASASEPDQFLEITVRSWNGGVHRSSAPSCIARHDIRDGIQRLAELIYEQIDPLQCAYYLAYYRGAKQESLAVLQRYIAVPQPKYAAYAYTLEGTILDSPPMNTEGNLAAANEDFRRAVDINPGLANAYYQWAGLFYTRHNFTEALNLYQKAMDAAPRDDRPYVSRSYYYFQNGRYPEAVCDLQQAVRLDPNSATNHFAWGVVRLWQVYDTASQKGILFFPDIPALPSPPTVCGEEEQSDAIAREAETQFRAAIALQPDYADAHTGLGKLLARERAWNAAASEYSMAIGGTPGFFPRDQVLDSWGSALEGSGQRVEAAEKYNAAVQANAKNVVARLHLASTLRSFGKNPPPLTMAGIILAKPASSPNQAVTPVKVLGMMCPSAECADRTVKVLEEALKLDANSYDAHYQRGLVYEDESDWPDASDEFQKARKLGGPDALTSENLVTELLKSLCRAGRQEEAAEVQAAVENSRAYEEPP
jgi:tetratricopeptide (TPR) repeat protein